jgi:hypothetical protein
LKHKLSFENHTSNVKQIFIRSRMQPIYFSRCYRMPFYLPEVLKCQVRTNFVRSDLHSRRCLSELARCGGMKFYFFKGWEIFCFLIFLGWEKKYSLASFASWVGL